MDYQKRLETVVAEGKKFTKVISPIIEEVERLQTTFYSLVQIIFGENDTVVGKKGRILLDSKLKTRFEGIELPGCGHYIPYESNPGSKEAAMKAVIEWLEG